MFGKHYKNSQSSKLKHLCGEWRHIPQPVCNTAIFFLPGNLVSIGPGVFSSNLTLDGPVRAIYVLNSCEFMYDGRLQSVHVHVVNPGWISIQIWRPINIIQNKGNLTLLHQRTIEILESLQTIIVSIDYVYISVLCHSNGCQFKILHFV